MSGCVVTVRVVDGGDGVAQLTGSAVAINPLCRPALVPHGQVRVVQVVWPRGDASRVVSTALHAPRLVRRARVVEPAAAVDHQHGSQWGDAAAAVVALLIGSLATGECVW